MNIQYITMNYIYDTYIVDYLLNLPDNVMYHLNLLNIKFTIIITHMEILL